ncbi:MAG: protoporphyrinogen oxidase HemJ [Gammaproteobacteria bacterium]
MLLSYFPWIKAFHIIFVVTWFAGLFYLPRIFVHHAMTEDQATKDRFKIMERKLYRFTTPSMALTIIFGALLIAANWSAYASAGWLYVKLLLIALLIMYHLWCGRIVNTFANDTNTKSHVWYRWFNEAPVIALFAIVILVVVKPF